VQFNCVKRLHEKLNWMFSGTANVSNQDSVFMSVLCVFLCVWLWWIKQGCRFLFAGYIGHNVIRKESVKCGVRSGIWEGIYLLNELLETDDAIVVSAGKLRILWDSLCELCSSLFERRLERTVLRPALLPVKNVHFTQFFRQVLRHTVKSPSLTESV
jgi:hypothetical protein